MIPKMDDARITAYVLDLMEPLERDRFEAELKADASLTAAVKAYRRVANDLNRALARETRPELSLTERKALRQHWSPATRPKRRLAWLWLGIGSLALIFLLARSPAGKNSMVFKGVNKRIDDLMTAAGGK